MESRQRCARFGVSVPAGYYPRLVGFVVLLAALVNAGNLGSLDPKRRLQQAHSWWTSTPEVWPAEGREYGVWGKGGELRANFGMGQALIFLPADVAASAVVGIAGRIAPLSDHVRDGAREVVVAFLMQSFVCSTAAIFAYLLLRRFGFGHAPAALGTLSLVLATTFLHYVQNCQENNLLLTCGLAGAQFMALWLKTQRARDAALAGAAFGYALLIRLTALADLGGAMVFLAIALWWDAGRRGEALGRFFKFARSAAPAVACFMVVERLYQYARFGNWLGTYAGPLPLPGMASGERMFYYPLWKGIRLVLWSRSDSIFLFDPLLVLSLALLAVFWRRIDMKVRGFAIGAFATLSVYIVFYAKFMSPTGETSWGDRYAQTPIHLLCLLAVPILWTFWREMARPVRIGMAAVVVWSVVQQIAALLVGMGVEPRQLRVLGIQWSIPQRFVNLWLVMTGQADSSPLFMNLPPEWRRINLLPFQLSLRYPELARWAVTAWCVLLAAALWVLRGLVGRSVVSSNGRADTSA